MIDALAKEKNTQKEKIHRRIKRERKAREMGKRARSIRGKNVKLPVMRAIATDKNGNNFECNSQDTMVPVIVKSNRIRQEQCKDTPFMIPPLLQDFGYTSYEDNTQRVLDGEYVPPEGTCPYAAEFIDTLRMPILIKNLEKIGLEVTAKENKEAWRKQKERTASAYGTPGFNHYKTSSYDKQLNEIDTFIRNLPVTVGFSPEE